MRARHVAHSLESFPVYSSAFISPNELVLGGGGGATRSGIKNKLRLYHVEEDMKLELVNELELEKGEDAPMSMAAHLQTKTLVCGVNSSKEKLEIGENENCRLYELVGTNAEGRLNLLRTQNTLPSGNLEDYQKTTAISPDGNFLAVSGGYDFSLLAYPSLSPVTQSIHIEKGEIYDVTFSSTMLVIATTVNLLVYSLPSLSEKPLPPKTRSRSKGKQKSVSLSDLKLLRTVELPSRMGGAEGSTFRAARFHPYNENVLYTVTNTVPTRSLKKNPGPRKAFVCKWDTETWLVVKVRKISDRGSTCFDVSPNGKVLAFGSSNYTIGLLDAITLNPLVSILKAHEFPPTTLRFNPESTLLISGSADNSLRVIAVPDTIGGQSSWMLTSIIVIFLIIILAIVVQQLLASDLQIGDY